MSIFYQNKKYQEHYYKLEADFENDVMDRSKLLFGKDSILINSKKKIDTQTFGGAIPDGILFNFLDKANPEFYLIEVEIKSHDFFRHIFPQITKFFAFFKNQKSQRELIDKIYQIIISDNDIQNEFKKFIGEKEIYKTIGDIISNSQNILLIIDGAKEELPEISQTYTDTWGKIVKTVIIKRFDCQKDFILYMDPDFETIEDIEDYNAKTNVAIGGYQESYHIDNIQQNTKDIYQKLKEKILELNPELRFNPQKYYISVRLDRNILFIKLRQKKLRIIVLYSYEEIISKNLKCKAQKLSQSVQDFYNGPSCALDLDDQNNIEEVVNLIKERLLTTIST